MGNNLIIKTTHTMSRVARDQIFSPDFSGEEPGYRDRSRDEEGGHTYSEWGGGGGVGRV